ncbi:MAG: OmpH family outer membrane protein [Cyclobacteriaceae bacterium]
MNIHFRITGLLLFLLTSLSATAQDIKIGYIDLDAIFLSMPDMKAADSLTRAYEQQLQATLTSKYQDFQVKMENYQTNGQSLDEVVKKDMEKELQNMQAQIEQFQTNANQAISQKKQELLTPLRHKVKEAINKIAEREGFTHVFASDGTLVYVRDETSNLSDLVAQELE